MRHAAVHGVPEAEIDVELARRHRIEREARCGRRCPQRTQPHRHDADLAQQELQKLGRPVDRNIHVLDHRLGVIAVPAGPALRELQACVPSHHARVGARVQPLPAEQAPHPGMLRPEVLGAPEPIGVPAPQVVGRAQVVDFGIEQRAVVDALAGVVAGGRRVIDEAAAVEHQRARRERHCIDKVGVALAGRCQGAKEVGCAVVLQMLDTHERLHRQRALAQPQCVAERAVRVGETVEQVAVLVVRGGEHHVAVGQQHLELEQAVVHQALAK